MKMIPKFEVFEKRDPLMDKISPELAEKISRHFGDLHSMNEASTMDSIKNYLSKSFLGSLSYLNMIDEVRSKMLNLEKELIDKKYKHEDEMEDLSSKFKEERRSNPTEAEKTKKIIENKRKEYDSFVRMTRIKIDNISKPLSDIIKGNKRRSEYLKARESQDELDLAEFEYSILKGRVETEPAELKTAEEEVKKAREEAEKTKEDLKDEVKSESEKEESSKPISPFSSDYGKSLKTKKGREEAILDIEHELVNLKKDLRSSRKDFDKRQIERKIKMLNGIKRDIEKMGKKDLISKIVPSSEFRSLSRVAKDLESVLPSSKGKKTSASKKK
jgi:hypothetical protein